MQIVPVIDLCGGRAVRAVKGQRAAYRPIVTPLAESSAPADVVAGLRRLHPFRTIYVADLDAIERHGNNRGVIMALTAAFPQMRFWVDAGARDSGSVREWLASPRIDPVIGSESLSSLDILRDLAGEPRVLLSLDFRGSRFAGPAELLDAPWLWPNRVIAMTLARVGAGSGPDLETLRAIKARTAIKARAGDKQVFGAGGVRDARDIDALVKAGIAGALIASALHDGGLSASDLAKYSGE